LVTEAQIESIDEQWFIFRGGTPEELGAAKQRIAQEHAATAARFASEKATLRERFGREPSDNDVQWGLLNQGLIDHANHRDWGLFRNTKVEMAGILRKEAKLTRALALYMEVCYLDVNGPNSLGGLLQAGQTDGESLRQFPCWNSGSPTAELAPGILSYAQDIIAESNLAPTTVEDIFRKAASALYTGLRLPLSPEDAWPKIRNALYD
jgi:hypothetical protein